jgi:hypothetical protein
MEYADEKSEHQDEHEGVPIRRLSDGPGGSGRKSIPCEPRLHLNLLADRHERPNRGAADAGLAVTRF